MMTQPLDELYHAVILDHFEHPRHRGELDQPTVRAEADNPLCGDEVRVDLRINGETVQGVAFDGQGCAVSLASASMMADAVQGKLIAEVDRLIDVVSAMVGRGEFDVEQVGDLESLQIVQNIPSRRRCALLPWEALSSALRQAWDLNPPDEPRVG